MSGPVQDRDVTREEGAFGAVEVREGRRTSVGPTDVFRVLPTKGRRLVGAWCFADVMVPPDAHDPHPLEIGPHPHIGLSTVTWLFEGEALHGDSLGTEQVIRPGQLNLMTAGRGIAHSELSTETGVHGVQMWVAQPERTRHGGSRFEHHADLPRLELPGAEAKVFMGALAGQTSPATSDTALVGAEISLVGNTEIEVDPTFELAVLTIDGPVLVENEVVEPGWLALLAPGRTALRLEARQPGTRVMLLGGEPLGERVQMWWNFVARTRDELTEAWRAWQTHDTDRFGPVPSRLPRMEAPPPPWLRAGES